MADRKVSQNSKVNLQRAPSPPYIRAKCLCKKIQLRFAELQKTEFWQDGGKGLWVK